MQLNQLPVVCLLLCSLARFCLAHEDSVKCDALDGEKTQAKCAIPSVRARPTRNLNLLTDRRSHFPGFDLIRRGIDLIPQSRDLDSAVEQFAEPLIRISTGGHPVPSDVGSILRSVPNLIVNMPGFGRIDVGKASRFYALLDSNLKPRLIEHVLNGGQIAGIPSEKLDTIVRSYMLRMHAAAARAQGLPYDPTLLDNPMYADRYLRPMAQLPATFVQRVMEGEPLPHLTVEQTQVVKDYYISRMESAGRDVNVTEIFPPKVVQMMKLLPPGYNLTRLPKAVLKSVMKGELPDMKLLPKDLQGYIRDNIGELFNSFAADPNTNIQEIDVIDKLPYYERPVTKNFSPYELFDDSHRKGRSFSLSDSGWRAEVVIPICIGAYALLTVLVVLFECLRLNRRYNAAEGTGRVLDIVETVTPAKGHRVPRAFRPDATSTFRKDNSVVLEPCSLASAHE